jgi:hypothetical protein
MVKLRARAEAVACDAIASMNPSVPNNTNLRMVVAATREIAQQTASASNGCTGLPT